MKLTLNEIHNRLVELGLGEFAEDIFITKGFVLEHHDNLYTFHAQDSNPYKAKVTKDLLKFAFKDVENIRVSKNLLGLHSRLDI